MMFKRINRRQRKQPLSDIQHAETRILLSGVTADVESVEPTSDSQNHAPEFSPGGSPISYVGGDGRYDVGDLVYLAGFANDPDGDAVSHEWLQIEGPHVALGNASSLGNTDSYVRTFTLQDNHAGQTLSFQLHASDGMNTTISDTVQINVEPTNTPPQIAYIYVGLEADGEYNVGDQVRLFTEVDDVDGDPLTFEWIQTTGPDVVLADATAQNTTFVIGAEHAGQTLGFYLRAFDGKEASNSQTAFIHTVKENTPPQFDYIYVGVEADGEYNVGDQVRLFTEVDDVDGDPLTFEWIQTTGPNVVLADATAQNTTFVIGSEHAGQTLGFYLRAFDGKKTSNSQTAFIHPVKVNSAPQFNYARAESPTDGVYYVGDRIHLSSDATDPDGDSLTYHWLQTAGTPVIFSDAYAKSLSFVVNSEHADQTLKFVATTSDGNSTVSSDPIEFHVNLPEPPLVAFKIPTDRETKVGDQIDLEVVVDSPNQEQFSYVWKQTGGPSVTLSNPTSRTPSFIVSREHLNQSLSFSVEISKGETEITTADVDFELIHTNHPPQITAVTSTATDGHKVGSVVTMTVWTKKDADGDTLNYDWTQTAGPQVSLTKGRTFVYPQADATYSQVKFTIEPEHAGQPVSFIATVSDGSSRVVSELFTIDVEPQEKAKPDDRPETGNRKRTSRIQTKIRNARKQISSKLKNRFGKRNAQRNAAKQKALQQRAAKQKAAKEKALKQRAAAQKAAKQKALKQSAAKQKVAKQKATQQKSKRSWGTKKNMAKRVGKNR